jgi:hypothetical protein
VLKLNEKLLVVAYREMCIKSIRMDFSTLLMLVAGRPTRLAGVHCFSAVTISCTVEGRSFASDAQLFITAESNSAFLIGNDLSLSAGPKDMKLNHSLIGIKKSENAFQ